ncbi:hypothetical protein AVEN_82132-1 [Araneus ventricosus]|uniref:Uncharacterized protein n=1 Tax=Araneus ventricosus TaxID=182803 RepID=A0A4Y2DAT8_ARAVE|nr:hypothetical protein AVEN_82132-1 [Araneus ventricosus]
MPVENSTLTLDTLKGKIQKIFGPLQFDLCGRNMSRLMHRIPQRIAFLEYFAAQEKLEPNTAASDFQSEYSRGKVEGTGEGKPERAPDHIVKGS